MLCEADYQKNCVYCITHHLHILYIHTISVGLAFCLDDSDDQVIHANVNEDGMVEVDDMIVSPDMFDVLYPHAASHPG